MAQMKAKRAFRYAGKPLAVGDPFDTKSDRDAVLLEAAGRATRTHKAEEKEAKQAKRRGRPPKSVAIEPSAVVQPDVYVGVDLADTSDETAVVEVQGDGRYNRRDLRADDE